MAVDLTVMGTPASSVFPGNDIFPKPTTPVFVGSQAGVPPVNSIEGDTGPGSGPIAYAASKQGSPAHQQPILWLLVLLVVGVVMLSHVAYLNIRG